MIPRPRPRIRAEPRTLHPSQPPTPETPQFHYNHYNFIKVKATQTLTPVRGVIARLFKPKVLPGGGPPIKRAATLIETGTGSNRTFTNPQDHAGRLVSVQAAQDALLSARMRQVRSSFRHRTPGLRILQARWALGSGFRARAGQDCRSQSG